MLVTHRCWHFMRQLLMLEVIPDCCRPCPACSLRKPLRLLLLCNSLSVPTRPWLRIAQQSVPHIPSL